MKDGSGLAEREREHRQIGQALDQAADGSGPTIIIEGPPGIGKTALLLDARREAGFRGIRTLVARAGEFETGFPWGVIRQLLEPELLDPERRDSLLEGGAGPAAPVFAEANGASGEGGDSSFSVLHGLYWLIMNLAGDDPLALVVDDLHWSDAPSLRALAYVARRLAGTGVVLLATVRNNEPGADPALLSELIHDPAALTIAPGPLGIEAVSAFIADRLGAEPAPEFCASCLRATGGNPLLLGQLLAALAAEGTAPVADEADAIATVGARAISRTVLRRLSRLPESAATVARSVAVLGQDSGVALVAELSDLDVDEAGRLTGLLAQSEILGQDTPLSFAHPLIREAVYLEMAPGRRQLLHARTARMLHESGAPAERVAAHLLSAEPVGETWAAESLRVAARSASRKGASESAVAFFERLLLEPIEEPDRIMTLLELGATEALANGPRAVEHLEAALEGTSEPASFGAAGYALARTLLFLGEEDRAVAVTHRVRDSLPDALGDLSLANEATELLAIYFGADVPDAEERLAAYAARPPSGGGAGARMMAATAAFDRAARCASRDECVPVALEAISGVTLAEVDSPLSWTAAFQVLLAGDNPEVGPAGERALEAGYRAGSLFGTSSVEMFIGLARLIHGELDEAARLFEATIEKLELWGAETGHSARALLIWTMVEQGRLAQAREQVTRAATPTDEQNLLALWSMAQLHLLLAEGNDAEAVAMADEVAQRLQWIVNPAWGQWRSLKALALARLGSRDEGLELVGKEITLARRWGAPSMIGRALRIRGLLLGEEGRADLEAAVSLLETSPARLELARALLALGSLLRRTGTPSESRGHLRRAQSVAENLGAEAVASEARTELRASGVRARSESLGGVEALTASELRVARLAAGGKTNKKIAQTLFVTPKTIEVHLSSAYRKLEIRSRRELGRALATGAEGA